MVYTNTLRLAMIVKTRQVNRMSQQHHVDRQLNTEPRGLLNPKTSKPPFDLTWYAPQPALAYFVEFYWVVTWDLRGQPPHQQENLPHPTVHLVIEAGRSGVFGVMEGKFSRLLEGKGRVFAVKFRPGGFYPFVQTPLTAFTNHTHSLHHLFGAAGDQLEAAVLAEPDVPAQIDHVERFLCGRLPDPDPAVETINTIIDQIRTDRTICKVDDLVGRAGMSKRTLQRLFRQYVGVSPKWVIQRYRLHEAADQLAAGHTLNLAHLAAELGYFDQAHFIKDFKAMVGKTPAEFARAGENSAP